MNDHDAETGRNEGWEVGWDGHARAQRRRIAALPWMRIDWLEDTQRLVKSLNKSRGEPDGAAGPADEGRP